jgi:Rieske Fe-S protein
MSDRTTGAPQSIPLLPESEPLIDRRGFLTVAGAAAIGAVLTGCGGGGGGEPTAPGTGSPGGNLPNGVVRDGNALIVTLASIPALNVTNGFLVVSAAPATAIVNLGNNEFRAFTAVCTHAGCLVSSYSAGRIRCACHNSFFDTQGRVVAGPAPRPLRAYATALDAAQGVLRVTTT